MSQKYENIMVAVDGSREAELAFEKGVNVALRNGSKLTLAHVVDTRALQSVSSFDAEVYEGFQTEANELLEGYIKRAKEAGVQNIASVVEMGNPKVLLVLGLFLALLLAGVGQPLLLVQGKSHSNPHLPSQTLSAIPLKSPGHGPAPCGE